MEHVAFLPHLQESIMEELRTTEGMLFRDESTKKLFIDVKSLVIDALTERRDRLHQLIEWDGVADEEIARSTRYGDISERLTSVTVLYAKYLYAKGNPDPINIKKPRVESLLKGMYTRLARAPHVRNGTFFDMDPIRQDFVIRDVFRLALANDCIVIIEKMPAVTVEEDVQDNGASHDAVSEVYPDDSISAVMDRAALTEFKPSEPIKEESVVSATSKASKATRLTQCVMPTNVRRIVLNSDDEVKPF
jgi:hypothetical protein